MSNLNLLFKDRFMTVYYSYYTVYNCTTQRNKIGSFPMHACSLQEHFTLDIVPVQLYDGIYHVYAIRDDRTYHGHFLKGRDQHKQRTR